MDVNKIKSAVLNQLQGTSGLYSLKLQNHIYGCFIVMEDLAQQNTVDATGTILKGEKFTFDFDKQFSEIGLRYGFAMDTKLVLDTHTAEYKEAWLELFKEIQVLRDLNTVDSVEDSVIEVIQHTVKSEEAFFINALNTGSLPQEWIDIVIKLLSMPSPNMPQSSPQLASNSDEDIKISATMVQANTEKPLQKRRRLDTTRRHKVTQAHKKGLAKTRRNFYKS